MESEIHIRSYSSSKEFGLVLLIKEILSQLDEAAFFLRQGLPGRLSRHLLREMCYVLRELPPELQQKYFEYLMAIAGREPAAERNFSAEAEIVRFQEVRRRFVQRIRVHLDLDAA